MNAKVTRHAARIAFIALAMALGSVISCVNSARCADGDIIFDSKNFADNGLAVGITGTLTGDGVLFKNNTYSIWCIKDREECLIATIAQMSGGGNHIGRLDYPYSMPITKWTVSEVVASDDPSEWSCFKTTITIERKSETALWVQEPINQAKPACLKSDTKIHKLTIK
ncbi:MAG: hypothetical protein JWP25_5596 [Bradyrhizobium sp.]|nr:hypothetical protein [Bradyrhizobium sp.]